MFASSVILGDLDDFIGPSQACINPLFTNPSPGSAAPGAPAAPGDTRGVAKITLATEDHDFGGRPLAVTVTGVGSSIASSSVSAAGGAGSLLRSGAGAASALAAAGLDDFGLRLGPSGARSSALGAPSTASGTAPNAPPAQQRPDLIKATGGPGSAAKVSLNDCLACSGCVTSAETVLITQQSMGEVERALKDPRYKVKVASLSPQALASIAHAAGIGSLVDAYGRLTSYLKAKGFDAVVDTVVGAEIALRQSCEEVVARLEAGAQRSAPGAVTTPPLPPPAAPAPTVAVSAVAEAPASGAGMSGPPSLAPDLSSPSAAPSLAGPLIASACPGWVCYAEKTVPEALPLLSRVRSPQAITGLLIKGALCGWGFVTDALRAASGAGDGLAPPSAGAGLDPGAVYHASVMPCFDKKLEASRKDFWWSASVNGDGAESSSGVREVDCVLSSSEVVAALAADGVALGACELAPRAGLYAPASPTAVTGAMTDDGEETTAVSSASPAALASSLFTPPSAALPPHSRLAALETLLCGVTADGAAWVVPSGTEGASDGYADVIYRYVAARVARAPLPPATPVPFVTGRNADFREAGLTLPAPYPPAFRVAIAYGFRNIQTVVTRVKRRGVGLRPAPVGGGSAWDYVEVMACPGGCVNGGGQAVAGASGSSSGGAGEACDQKGGAVPAAAVAAAKKAAHAAVSALLAGRVGGASDTAGVHVLDVAAFGAEEGAMPAPALAAAAAASLAAALPLPAAPSPALASSLLWGTRFHAVPKLDASAMRW